LPNEIKKRLNMKKIILFSLSLILFVSCKNEGNKLNESKEGAAEKVIDTVFTVTLNATVKKDDSFQIYYRKAGENSYLETNSFFTEFKGSDLPQDIVFRLPEEVIPEYIRMDFGVNKEQTEVKINHFKMSYFGKEFQTNKASEFFKLILIESKTATVDVEKGIIRPITIGDNHDPLGTSEKMLYDEIQKIVK